MVRAHRSPVAWRSVACSCSPPRPRLSRRCGPGVDVKQALQVGDVVTGWYDAGIVEGGKNKLVPSITFTRQERVARTPFRCVQFNAVFRVVGDVQELGLEARARHRRQRPGGRAQSVGPFTLQSDLGYTGEQPRAQMLQHRQFKDAQVEIFAKHGSRPVGEARASSRWTASCSRPSSAGPCHRPSRSNGGSARSTRRPSSSPTSSAAASSSCRPSSPRSPPTRGPCWASGCVGGLLALAGAMAYAELATLRPARRLGVRLPARGLRPLGRVPHRLDVVRGGVLRRDRRQRRRPRRLPRALRSRAAATRRR